METFLKFNELLFNKFYSTVATGEPSSSTVKVIVPLEVLTSLKSRLVNAISWPAKITVLIFYLVFFTINVKSRYKYYFWFIFKLFLNYF